MKVRREGNHIWLENGFPEFVKYYSIGYGHLLTFNYQSFSTFSLNVCDKNGCEIEYPSRQEVEQEVEIVEETGEASTRLFGFWGLLQDRETRPRIIEKLHLLIKSTRVRGKGRWT
ncbi:hypothetical protein M5689_013544 [Euphorbia peplus]|nr:hypothetical protein M5689_013544 [Euphorbia peplus]